jgi:hypothetical protein
MPNPDYRALCAEILQTLDQYEDGQRVDWDAWRETARAALAQPKPQEPTDKELHQLWQELYGFHDGPTSGEVAEIARAVLARWGTPANEPVPVAATDEELMAAARKAVDTYPRGSELPYFLYEDSSEYEPMLLALRAAARWSTPVNNIKGED